MSETPLYKILVDGKSCHGGNLQWDLPIENVLEGGYIPGRWHSVKGKLELCSNGLHVCSWDQAWKNWMKIDADLYRVETKGKVIRDNDKSVARSVRLLEPVEMPDWWVKTREEITTFKDMKWFQPDGNPDPEWKLFTADSWNAARKAAWNAAQEATWEVARKAAWGAARGAAWDAAWDAALNTLINITCTDLLIDQKYRDYAAKRWQAWKKGYAVLCDVDGVLYVYAQGN